MKETEGVVMELEVASEAAGEALGTAERAQERVRAARVRECT